MIRPIKLCLAVFCLFLIASCGGGTLSVKRPDPITLEKGLEELAEALKHLNELSDGIEEEDKIGLIPSQVQVQLQVGISEVEGASRELQIVPGNAIAEIASITGSRNVQVTENSGSTITLTFTNYLFAAGNSVLGMKSPEQIDALRKYLLSGFGTLSTQDKSQLPSSVILTVPSETQ